MGVKVTYYLEVLSSWCYWAEPAWAELKARYAGRVEFDWKIALMNPGDFPISRAQCDWFYRRSGGTVMHSPFMLSSDWMEVSRKGDYSAADYVADAAKDFGFTGDTVRLALSHAAMRDGRKIGDLDEAVAAAVGSSGELDAKKLRQRAQSAEVKKRVAASTTEFHAHQINQRPAFIVTDSIDDKAVFSGLASIEPLAAAIEAMLSDTAAYEAHAAHFGPMPKK